MIGSGIGGLSAAAMLAMYGENVTVVESHDIPGGCAHGESLNHTDLGFREHAKFVAFSKSKGRHWSSLSGLIGNLPCIQHSKPTLLLLVH